MSMYIKVGLECGIEASMKSCDILLLELLTAQSFSVAETVFCGYSNVDQPCA